MQRKFIHRQEIIELKPNEKWRVRSLSTFQLAKIYGVSNVTLKRWLKPFAVELGTRNGWYYSVAQVKIIIKHLGFPEILEDE